MKALKIPMYFFEPFINAWHMIFMTTWENSYCFPFLVLSQANVTPVIDDNIYKDLE